MAEYDINNANDYVPDEGYALPPSAVGKGGLSAMNAASHGSPQAPNRGPISLGGLVSPEGQAKLEELLFPRVRDTATLAAAKEERRGGLSKLQAALAQPENNLSGLEQIARGMARNTQPWDAGAGFRQGVAGAFDADEARQKLAREAGIKSAAAEMDFNKNEEGIDDKVENTAISNLRALAKPIRAGGGAGGAGGVRFKSVPGVGLVDTWAVDDSGVPKVVYGDGKVLTETRMKARKLAEAEAESQQNNMTFNSDAERNSFIVARTDEITAQMLANTVPGTMHNGAPSNPAAPSVAPARGAAPAAAGKVNAGFPAGTKLPAATPTGTSRYDVLSAELADAQASGRKTDVESLQREIARLPAGEKPALAPDGSLKLEGPESQRGRIKTAEEVAKAQAESAAKLQADAETGMNMKSTVDELRQLKFNPGMFAKWKQRGGNLAEAFGVNGPLAHMAAQSGNAESLLQALSNARISLEKGVQTRDDEVRFKAELAKITDPREAYDYMLKHMTELGNRSVEHYNTVEDYRKQNGGTTYDGANQVWQKRMQEYGGMVKRYQGAFIGRSEFIDHMTKDPANIAAYKGDAAALKARAEKEWLKLGGK
jgi:hypothetical protein